MTTYQELDQHEQKRFQKLYPGTNPTPVLHRGAKAKQADKLAKSGAKAKQVREVLAKPKHVGIMWVLVGACAYVLLGLGWFIGVIGDSLYEVGKRMHEAKHNIT